MCNIFFITVRLSVIKIGKELLAMGGKARRR